MALAWRYAALGIGAIGTLLAALTLLLAPFNLQRIGDMPTLSMALFITTVATGAIQWAIFQRRQFRAAVGLFCVTLAGWSLAAATYADAVATDLRCREHPCQLVLVVKPQS